MTEQKQLKLRPKRDVTISGRVPADDGETLDTWCLSRFRKRSEVVGLIVSTVLAMVRENGGINQAVEDFVRKLRFEPA